MQIDGHPIREVTLRQFNDYWCTRAYKDRVRLGPQGQPVMWHEGEQAWWSWQPVMAEGEEIPRVPEQLYERRPDLVGVAPPGPTE